VERRRHVKAIVKFLSRIERLIEDVAAMPQGKSTLRDTTDRELNYARHYAIKSISADAERFQFNTSISRMMELLNAIGKYQGQPAHMQPGLLRTVCEDLIRLMAPFAPHFSEEQWSLLGHRDSIFHEPWPIFDPSALIRDTVEIAVQVNGAIKYRLEIPTDAAQDEVEALIRADSRTETALAGRSITKFIFVKGRLANLVAK
jgi:leucyl-tRNA synthetase